MAATGIIMGALSRDGSLYIGAFESFIQIKIAIGSETAQLKFLRLLFFHRKGAKGAKGYVLLRGTMIAVSTRKRSCFYLCPLRLRGEV
jgi:hypothetical protein